jgi:hypothetical protein
MFRHGLSLALLLVAVPAAAEGRHRIDLAPSIGITSAACACDASVEPRTAAAIGLRAGWSYAVVPWLDVGVAPSVQHAEGSWLANAPVVAHVTLRSDAGAALFFGPGIGIQRWQGRLDGLGAPDPSWGLTGAFAQFTIGGTLPVADGTSLFLAAVGLGGRGRYDVDGDGGRAAYVRGSGGYFGTLRADIGIRWSL